MSSKFNNKTIIYIITGIIIVAVIGLFTVSMTATMAVKVGSDKITAGCVDPLTKCEMKISDVKDVYLKDTIPNTSKIMGTGGIGSLKEGSFNVDGLGKGHVFTESSKGPFLYIIGNNDFIIYESKDAKKVNDVYKEVIAKTGINPKQQ